ncbi:MAG: DHH family phosphoesterase, partial [Clostridia bacterium]|nr:DHH family phosphoesterase [Clostridia bacterium]
MKAEFKKIYKKIKQYDNIVIARHISPDPDAVASQIALRDAIKLTFPKKNVYAVGTTVSKFKYYGSLDKIETVNENSLLIALDVPNISRIDGVDVNQFKEILKIDHHPSDEVFGDVDYVDEKSSSTCQIIIEFIFDCGLKINKKIAEILFLGVVSDSDRFLISYSSAKTFKLIAKLIEISNIEFTKLYSVLYERPYSEIKFHGYLSDNFTITENGFGYINISLDVLKKYNVDAATPSNMINDFS